MGKRRLLPLCVCTLVVYAGIGGLVGLMPVYLTRLGANAAITGALLASAYLALALSNVGAGRLAERGQRRRAYLIIGGALAAPVAWLLGRATTVEQIWVLLAGLWFLLGLPMTMANILTGLLADAAYRGRSFGVLTLVRGAACSSAGWSAGRSSIAGASLRCSRRSPRPSSSSPWWAGSQKIASSPPRKGDPSRPFPVSRVSAPSRCCSRRTPARKRRM